MGVLRAKKICWRQMSVLVRRFSFPLPRLFGSVINVERQTISQRGYFTRKAFNTRSSVFVNRVQYCSSEARDLSDVDTRLVRYERGLELLDQAQDLLKSEKFPQAEQQYSACISTFSAHLEYKYPNENVQTMMQKRADLLVEPTVGLAFAQHCLGKLEEARENYKQAFEWMKVNPELEPLYARNLLNYAELLCHMEKPVTATEVCEESLPLIEKHYGKRELYASGLSNMAVYLGIQQHFARAITYAKEALDLFSKELGKNNPYTDGALQVYLRLLRDNDQEKEADEILEAWSATRKQADLPPPDQLSQDLAKSLEETLKPFANKKPFDPKGTFTTPEILQEQQKQFSAQYDKADFSQPGFSDTIQQEISDLYNFIQSRNSHQTANGETNYEIASIDLNNYFEKDK